MSDAASFIAAIKNWAQQHHLPPAAIERWLGFGEADAMAILTAARNLRLRTGQMLTALDLLAEIGVREGEGAAPILARDELRAIMTGGGSRPERAAALIEKLRELRYPRLARARARLEAAVAAMRLPRGLAVVLPRDLSSDELVIRLTARSPAELENLLAAVDGKKEELKALLQMLGGSDEI